MKNYLLKTVVALALLVFSLNSNAQAYVIFGQVSNNNGVGLPNQIINVQYSDTLTTGVTSAITDSLGTYQVTMVVLPNVVQFLYVTYVDECGNYLQQVINIFEPNSLEVNFVSCSSITPPQSCAANFYYKSFNNTVSFFDLSYAIEPINQWAWSFGDGTSSAEQNPMHTYSQTGSYYVTLSIWGDTCQSTTSQYIYNGNDTTWNQCYASFWYTNDPTSPLSISFQNISSVDSTATFTWDFGDNTTSNQFMPSHTYSQTGVYYVTLTVENVACGLMTYSDYVYVDQYPYPSDCYADFYYSTDTLGYTFEFYNASWSVDSLYSVNWDFGDGNSSTEINPVHTYNADGQYEVILTLASSICTSSTKMIVYVGANNWYPQYCQAFFFPEYSWNNIKEIKFVDYSYGNGAILSYNWDFGDGTGSNQQNPIHTFSANGEYLVTLTINTENCTSTFNELVYIQNWNWFGSCNALFFPNFDETLSVQFYDLSNPFPTTWHWDFGDNTTSTEQNPIHTYAQPGIYTVTLETTSDSLCSSAFAMEIELYQVNKGVTYAGKINEAYAIAPTLTDVKEVDNKGDKIKLYPNPVGNELNVNISNNFDKAQIQIISITGQIVFNGEFTENNVTINTSNLKSGFYVARIITDGKISNIKFVK